MKIYDLKKKIVNNSKILFMFLNYIYYVKKKNICKGDWSKGRARVERSCHDSWSEPRTPDNPP